MFPFKGRDSYLRTFSIRRRDETPLFYRRFYASRRNKVGEPREKLPNRSNEAQPNYRRQGLSRYLLQIGSPPSPPSPPRSRRRATLTHSGFPRGGTSAIITRILIYWESIVFKSPQILLASDKDWRKPLFPVYRESWTRKGIYLVRCYRSDIVMPRDKLRRKFS